MTFPTLDFSLFRVIAPEFSSVSNSVLQKIADSLTYQFNEEVWGQNIDIGLVYLTAHTLKMRDRNGIGGQVSSSKVGDLSRNYTTINKDNAYYQTSYGREYINLVNKLITRPFVVT